MNNTLRTNSSSNLTNCQFLSTASIVHLAAISVERLLAVVYLYAIKTLWKVSD